MEDMGTNSVQSGLFPALMPANPGTLIVEVFDEPAPSSVGVAVPAQVTGVRGPLWLVAPSGFAQLQSAKDQ